MTASLGVEAGFVGLQESVIMNAESVGRGRRVVIVGAGFSGLVSAYYLWRSGFKVTVLEKESKAGGLIETLSHELGPVETAANGLLNSLFVEELFATFDVQPLLPNKISRRRFILRDGRPRRWPLGFRASLRFFLFLLSSLLFRPWVRPRSMESVADWGARVMGREASKFTIEAALQGIYAGDSRRMSARLVFGRFFGVKNRISKDMEDHHPANDVTQGKHRRKKKFRGTISVEGGMGALIRHLHEGLKKRGVEFKMGVELTDLAGLNSETPVVLATSCAAAGKLLEKKGDSRAQDLLAIELLPVVTATLFFKNPVEKGQGFGVLFPPEKGRLILGALMNSLVFSGKSQQGYSETWILGGAHSTQVNPALFDMSDSDIISIIEKEREKSLQGRPHEILGSHLTRWRAALPHYTIELEKSLPKIDRVEDNVFLIGNYLGQIGLAKILERATVLPFEVAQKGFWS